VSSLVLAKTPLRPPPPRIESARGTEKTTLPAPQELDDSQLLVAIRDGEEAAFAALVARHHGALRRVAASFGASDALAEEVVQETWLAALQGLDSFGGRSSLEAWLFGILRNQARRRAARERRSVPLSALGSGEEGEGPVVDSLRFQGPDGNWPDHWSSPPRPWEDPERRLASLEAREHLRRAIAGLPERQRAVVVLRDVEGLDATEVCELLEISEGNQRVLLHRARSSMRTALEGYVDG
jgi:RNA polymerase sigma-70 factor, ECF subfamily